MYTQRNELTRKQRHLEIKRLVSTKKFTLALQITPLSRDCKCVCVCVCVCVFVCVCQQTKILGWEDGGGRRREKGGDVCMYVDGLGDTRIDLKKDNSGQEELHMMSVCTCVCVCVRVCVCTCARMRVCVCVHAHVYDLGKGYFREEERVRSFHLCQRLLH